MRYVGSSVVLQETGKEWHPANHIFAGGDVQDRSRGRLVQLDGGTIHVPGGGQLKLLKGAEKDKTGFYVITATRPGTASLARDIPGYPVICKYYQGQHGITLGFT